MMFERIAFAAVVAGGLVLSASAQAACDSIQSGQITDIHGNPLGPGFDQWGYNYQAHLFNGLYENYSRPQPPVTESDTMLQMKWSDSWLANKDCDGDGKLDRGLVDGVPNGISQGWLTNHMVGTYADAQGEPQTWTYFVKIVYMPEGCPADPQSWGPYCIIEEVYNDPANGFHGVNRDWLIDPAGLGLYK
jgi:hypothetical protein